MTDRMEFPPTFEEFIKEYELKDNEDIYTINSKLIPSFRVMQAWEHYTNNLRNIDYNINNIYNCLAKIEDNLSNIAYEVESI